MIATDTFPVPERLAPYACHAADSRGRLHDEPASRTRTAFQRDRDRIIHSAAFRRLKWKTQVFVYHEGDYFRTRLTHSLEVSQIARSICSHLGLNQDLAEALALAHDLGHAPFGHAGEHVLKNQLQDLGGFDHNVQSLRLVTKLEERYAAFDGLNLTWETLEGLIKHNGPLRDAEGAGQVADYVAQYDRDNPLALETWPSAEAQVASLADDIAYNNHDIDDGLRAGLFAVADLEDVPLVGPVFHETRKAFPDTDESRLIHEAVRRMFGLMVEDLTTETARRLRESGVAGPADVRRLGGPVAAFSDAMRRNDAALKDFLFHNMYRHHQVNRMTSKARRVIHDLFTLLKDEPGCLPTEWRRRAGEPGSPRTTRLVADYVAGMTDRFALEEHRRLFDLQIKP